MAGLLDFLSLGADIYNPMGPLARGLLSQVGPPVIDFYKNQTAPATLPQSDPAGTSFNGFNMPMPVPAPERTQYAQGSDPMTAGGYPQSGPSSITLPAPLPNPIAVGKEYLMPRVGDPSSFVPNSTPTDVSSQNRQTSSSAPMQYSPPASEGGISGFGRGLAANLHNGPIGALFGGIAGAAGMGQGNPQQRMGQAVFQALKDKMDPSQALAVAQAAASDPKLAEVLLPQALGLKPPANVEGVIAERMYNQKPGSANDPGLSDYAKFLQTKNQAEKSGSTLGEQQATAQLNLPSAIAQSKEAMAIADRLMSHKGREGNPFFHGKASSYLGDALIPGNTQAYDANSLLQQLKGGAFLNAYSTLRGGGQISNTEGAKAEQAILRANRAQSKEEFDSAIKDFKSSLQLAIDNASYRAGQNPPYGFQGSQLGVGQSTTINGVPVRRIN